MGKGVLRARLSSLASPATTSISPVARLGFKVSAGRRVDAAAHRDDELAAQLARQLEGGLPVLRIEDYLDDAAAVAQVDEDEAAVIAARVHPAHDGDVSAGVGGAQVTAVGAAFPVSKSFGCHARCSTE